MFPDVRLRASLCLSVSTVFSAGLPRASLCSCVYFVLWVLRVYESFSVGPVFTVLTVPPCPQCSLCETALSSLCYRHRAHSSYLSFVALCLCLKQDVVQQAVVLRALQEATFNIRMLQETLAGFIILLCLA